jgi:hypothetical protein
VGSHITQIDTTPRSPGLCVYPQLKGFARLGPPPVGEPFPHPTCQPEKCCSSLRVQHAEVLPPFALIKVGEPISCKRMKSKGKLESAIEALSPLAPLHNPPNPAGNRASRGALADIPHVGVLNTTCHQSLSKQALTLAIRQDLAIRTSSRGFSDPDQDALPTRCWKLRSTL